MQAANGTMRQTVNADTEDCKRLHLLAGSAALLEQTQPSHEVEHASTNSHHPPMCPMKMLFKKLPSLQTLSASSSNSELDSAASLKREATREDLGPPTKKSFGTRSSASLMGAESEASCSAVDTSVTVEVESLKHKLTALETELFYCKADLLHEQARWGHIRRRAQRLKILGVLMGIADLDTGEVSPLKDASHSETLLVLELQVLEAKQALAEEAARSQTLSVDIERLAAENQALQRQLMLHKAQDASATDKVLEHPLYKKVLTCYHQERLLGQTCSQHLETVKADLQLEGRRCRVVQETIEEQEKRKRKKFEQLLYERDHRLTEKEAAIKDLSHRLRKFEVIAEQAVYEQQKAKEYPVLIASLKREIEKLRQRLDRQRREGREEDLASEVESISKAYEDMSEQNSRLLAQLDEKDRLNNNLLTERLKNQHSLSLLKAEAEASAQALEATERVRANQEAWMLKMQDVLQTLQTEEKQLGKQCHDLQTVACQQERELVQVGREVEELRQHQSKHQEAASSYNASAEELVQQHAQAQAEARRKTEELQRIQMKYESLVKKAAEPIPKPNTTDSSDLHELKSQVMALRAVLNCNVCGMRRKSTIITRCFHLFCQECVDDNLRDRKRKCPQCATKFSESDVKSVFLCDK